MIGFLATLAGFLYCFVWLRPPEIAGVANDPAPGRNRSKVEMLRNNEFVRIWIDRGGHHYLVHLVPANQGKGN